MAGGARFLEQSLRVHRYLRAAAIACVAFCDCAAGQVLDQLWPEANVFVKLSENTRLFLLGAGTRERVGGYSDGQLGAHVDFFISPVVFKARAERHPDIARSKFLQIRLGYLFGKTPQKSETPFVEHMPTAEVTPRYYGPKGLLLSNRNRVDFRFVDGVYTPRYRNRLKLERGFAVGKRSLTPYGHAEAFYDWRYNSFHRFRFAAGAELELTRWFVFESYYLRQQDSTANPQGLNVAGIALQFYIR